MAKGIQEFLKQMAKLSSATFTWSNAGGGQGSDSPTRKSLSRYGGAGKARSMAAFIGASKASKAKSKSPKKKSPPSKAKGKK